MALLIISGQTHDFGAESVISNNSAMETPSPRSGPESLKVQSDSWHAITALYSLYVDCTIF